MNVLSLFDGMSCGQIALERAGIKVDNYFASEIDKHAIQVTMHNYPNTIQLGDVRNIDLSKLPKIDLLIGGSPCQSFSFVGKREGMATECKQEITTLEQYLKLKSAGFQFKGQSYLFWEFVYILRKLKPKYFLLENVRMSNHWKNVIDNTLGVKAILINSALVSAQNRPRLYWTNITNTTIPKNKGAILADVLDVNSNEDKRPCTVVSTTNVGWCRCVALASDIKGYRVTRAVFCKSAKSGCLVTLTGGNRHIKVYLGDNQYRRLTPLEYERLQTVPEGYTKCVSNTHRYTMLGNGWTVDIIAHIFKNIGKEPKPFFKTTLF